MSNSCCSKDSPCDIGGGDCDNDSHCAGNLICGENNCVEFNTGIGPNM